MKPRRLKKMPSLRSDAAAERLVETLDLTKYDVSEFKPMRFELTSLPPRRVVALQTGFRPDWTSTSA